MCTSVINPLLYSALNENFRAALVECAAVKLCMGLARAASGGPKAAAAAAAATANVAASAEEERRRLGTEAPPTKETHR